MVKGEHGFGKPEERASTHAMKVLEVGPHETWMVSDNLEWEVVAPQRLGIHGMPRCPTSKRPGAFNAHNPADGGSGLVQPVFRSPARIAAAESTQRTVRRAAKRKTLYVIMR
jgi:FMN phosphatase YigB (HAD superfamily)